MKTRHLIIGLLMPLTLPIGPDPSCGQPADERAAKRDQKVEAADRDAKESPASRETDVWTCRMHPQIRTDHQGRCPICGSELAAAPENTLITLDEMLFVALRHNPEVRAAEADLRRAEANLDRTRLEVVQKIIAFREKWQAENAGLIVAEHELRQSEASAGKDPTGAYKKALDQAREKYAFVRARLAEVEAELPFLLGRPPGQRSQEPYDATRDLIRDELLPKAEKMVALLVQEYQTGNAELSELSPWLRRVMDLQKRLAGTTAKRIAAIEAYRGHLKQLAQVAETKYRAGQAKLGDVLAVEYLLDEAELAILDAKGQ